MKDKSACWCWADGDRWCPSPPVPTPDAAAMKKVKQSLGGKKADGKKADGKKTGDGKKSIDEKTGDGK
eukprot:441803-Pyramimonas_sp.AAC.1